MKLIKQILAASLTLCLFSTHVMAQDVTDPTEGGVIQEAVISPMKEGQIAPFDGVLFSLEANALLIAEKKAQPEKTQAEVTKAVDTEKAQCQAKVAEVTIKATTDLKISRAEVEASNKTNDLLLQDVKKLERRAKLAKTWMIISGVAGVAAVGLAVGLGFSATK